MGSIWWLLSSCLFHKARETLVDIWKSSALMNGWSRVSNKIWGWMMGCDRDQCDYCFMGYGVQPWRSHNVWLVHWVPLLVSSDCWKHHKHVAKSHVGLYKHRRCRKCHRVIWLISFQIVWAGGPTWNKITSAHGDHHTRMLKIRVYRG